MHTDEVQKEIFAVEIAHGAVPGAGYQDEKDKAGKEVHMGHFLQVFFIEEKEQARKPGKEDADGALGEGGQGSKEIAEEIVFPVFRIPQVEESHGAAHEKEEGGVGNDGLGENPAFHRGAQDDGGEPACLFPIGAAGKPVGKEDGSGAQNGGRKAGGHFIKAEEGKGKGQLPVVENGLVIPVAAVNPGRNPVAGKHHFLGS